MGPEGIDMSSDPDGSGWVGLNGRRWYRGVLGFGFVGDR